MSSKPSRREFLVTASLAGAALAAGAAAGCGGKKEETQSTGQADSSGGIPGSSARRLGQSTDVAPAKTQVHVDEVGRLVVDDPKLADQLSVVWRTHQERAPHAGKTYTQGISVVFDSVTVESSTVGTWKPKGNPTPSKVTGAGTTGTLTGPAGKPINSLCTCSPAE